MPHNDDTVRARGIRKSRFPEVDTIPEDATLDFVAPGVNLKIGKQNFIDEMGATGTIVQAGAITGTPVLDKQASVNNIRNLENGPGVKSNVSPENGITLEHNFIFDSAGAALSQDPTLPQPVFRSLVAGTGISVGASLNQIQISLTSDPTAGSTIIISQISDFPAPVVGVITLAASTDYLIVANITTTNRFILQNDTLVRAVDSSQVRLTYTGTGDMFTSLDASNKITQISITCTTGSFLNIKSTTGAHVFQLVNMTVDSCDKIGVLDGLFATQFTDVAFLSIVTDGVQFVGAHGLFLAQTDLSIIAAGSLFDLGTATFDTFSYGSSQVALGGTSIMLKGATGSANINAGGLGTILNTRITGTGIPLSGITTDDALWQFLLNDDIADTRPDGLLSLQSNATNTVIATAGVGVLVAGTWVVETTSQMTGTTAGRLTYDGGKDAKLPISGSVTIEPASGGAQTLGVQVAINGTVIANSLQIATTSASNPTNIPINWQENLSPADFVELFVSNISTTTDVLVSTAVLRVN